MFLTYYLKGLGLGAGLIVAIGSQNAHVLRMGLLQRHVGLTVLTCIICETLLIASGVAGMGALISDSPVMLAVARWGGAAFLLWYGLRAWRSALSAGTLAGNTQAAGATAGQALGAVLAVTLLNPHVYLDTVILLGAVGGQQPGDGKAWFALGAMSAAAVWFTALGYGARLLSPWFARPVTWRVLDGVIGVVMIALAAALVLSE
jgi:L-lysine exporter family protein LysE/ArgO